MPNTVGIQSSSWYSQTIIDLFLGPIVRINPNEVHCNDINFADEIYTVGARKRDKPQHQINGSA